MFKEVLTELHEFFFELGELILALIGRSYFMFILFVYLFSNIEPECFAGMLGHNSFKKFHVLEGDTLRESLLTGFEIDVCDVKDEAAA